MFKAVNAQSGAEIISLDSKWNDRIEYLRALSREGSLLCQGCKQPVRLRAGEVNRTHFAHKSLQDCSYGKESPKLLALRAVLYKRLAQEFGEQVTIEKQLDDYSFPRPVDCWVEKENGNIAYWIIDAGLRPNVRQQIEQGFQDVNTRINWVFSADMMRIDESDTDKIHLSTTEREFMQPSVFNEEINLTPDRQGKSLHYLDHEDETLTTFRGLRVVHSPNVYKGRELIHPLSDILLPAKTGEFVHPGEREQWQHIKHEKTRIERERALIEQEKARAKQAEIQFAEEQRTRLAEEEHREMRRRFEERSATNRLHEYRTFHLGMETDNPTSVKEKFPVGKPSPTQKRPAALRENEPATCMICGETTTLWWFRDGQTKKCKCNNCLAQGKS